MTNNAEKKPAADEPRVVDQSAAADGSAITDSAMVLSGLTQRARNRRVTPGELPGIEHLAEASIAPKAGSVSIQCIDYCANRIEAGSIGNLDEFLAEPMADWIKVRWINVSHPHPYIINRLRRHFEFHTLTAEDIMHIPQRARVEFFDHYSFVVLRMLQLVPVAPRSTTDKPPTKPHRLDIEQVSLVLFDKVLVTFQQRVGDVWGPIRNRLESENNRIRSHGADYLLYALLDELIDHCFPVLEQYGDGLEEIERAALDEPASDVLHRIHVVKRELSVLRGIVWPMRAVIDQLYREEGGRMGEATKPFLRDVYEHTIQIVEIIESYREMVNGLTDLYMSAVSNRMNEIMKLLTIMASVFIPLTFIVGVYGMNFEYMPELQWRWAYPAVWVLCIVITVAMLMFFNGKGWLGRK